jgi:DNA-binding response OmpR family regulator
MHEQGGDAGIQEFICKPFRIEELQRVLLSTPRLNRTL